MAYNTRRSVGEGANSVGMRRTNPPMSNPNFIPGGQRSQQNMKMQQHPPQQVQQHPPQQMQQHPPQQMQQQQQQQQQQQVRPPVQPPQQQPPPPLQQPTIDSEMTETMEEEGGKKKPFWMKRLSKVTKKERTKRRNVRLNRMLQPKNAVMILNELVKSASYTVSDLPNPADMNQYSATVLVDGISHVGHGRSKVEAKNVAAENAIKYIIKNRQISALKQEPENNETTDSNEDMKMETEEGGPTIPWQHVASFALYKLLQSWGEDPVHAKGLFTGGTNLSAPAPGPNKPAKKMPEGAAHMNPLMLLNQMMPHAQFEEMPKTGTPPNIIFTFQVTVDGQTFTGTGQNKKAAKRMAAFGVCSKILGVEYPPEVYSSN